MPHIIVQMFPGRDEASKKELAEKLAGLTAETLGLSQKCRLCHRGGGGQRRMEGQGVPQAPGRQKSFGSSGL